MAGACLGRVPSTDLRIAAAASMTSATSEVEAFLATLGLEQYAQTLIYNGFYTSVDALRTAAYHELLECQVKPVHARLIISNLRGGGTPASSQPGSSGEAGVISP